MYFVKSSLHFLGQLALATFIGLGIAYSATTLTAEFFYQRGAALAAPGGDAVAGLRLMEVAERLAPELGYLRVGPARVAMINAGNITLKDALPPILRELKRDPYSLDMLNAVMIMCMMLKDQNCIQQAFLRMHSFAPNSLPVRTMLTALQQLKAAQEQAAKPDPQPPGTPWAKPPNPPGTPWGNQ